MNVRLTALSGVWIAALACGGCAAFTAGPANKGAAEGGPAIGSAQLDQLTQAFADRYVGLLASARDALKKDNPDPKQRSEAQYLLMNGATNIYDIASNSDCVARVLDLIVVTTLLSQVWIDDDRATEIFGDRAQPLIHALHQGRVEAWAMAAQVLRPEQLDLLDYLLWNWRRHNSDMARVYVQRIQFVRFSDFAVGNGKSAEAEVLAAGGLFANVAQATEEIGQARLLTERMFYILKREPTLLRWQAETLQDTMLADPQVSQTLADMHRLTDQIERLPKNVAAERQALLSALDERMNRADAAAAEVKAVLGEAKQLVAAMGTAGDSLRETLKMADGLYARYSALAGRTTAAESRPFDIREYTEAMKELAVATDKVNEVLKSSNELLGSPEWNRRVQQMNEAADAGVRRAGEQSDQLVNHLFRRVYAVLGILFAIVITGLGVAFVLARQLMKRAAGARGGDADRTGMQK